MILFVDPLCECLAVENGWRNLAAQLGLCSSEWRIQIGQQNSAYDQHIDVAGRALLGPCNGAVDESDIDAVGKLRKGLAQNVADSERLGNERHELVIHRTCRVGPEVDLFGLRLAQDEAGLGETIQFALNLAHVPSKWIIAAARRILTLERPDLPMVYVPHLYYDLQRFGPDSPQAATAAREIDTALKPLLDFATAGGHTVVALSEYGITNASRPVDVNRALRRAGLLNVYVQAGMEYLDPWTSRAFAVGCRCA